MSWPDLPPLNTLLPFEATVRHASVTRAAQELHLTHGAVSRQILNLERALGAPLFERRPRSMRPTAAAQQLAAAIRDALDQVDAAARQVSRARDTGTLALSCEPTLLMRWLIPRLPDLVASTPSVNLHLSAGGGTVFFARDEIDVAIRRDDFAPAEGITRSHLFDERIGPVCRPDIAARLTDPAQLGGWPLLHTRTRPQAWSDWRRHARVRFPASTEQTFEHFYLALQAAVAGLGIAIGPYALVQDDLTRGQLAAPFGFVPDNTSYHLLSIRPPDQDDRIAVLLRWLRSQVVRADEF